MLNFAAEHPLIFIILCCLFAAVSLFLFAIALMEWRRNQPIMAALACLGGLGYLWPVGLMAKMAVFGPAFLRWYVADLGFVALFGLVAAISVFTQKQSHPGEPKSQTYARMIDKLAMTRRVMVVAFVGITTYELLMGVMYLTSPGIKVQDVGSTDPIDLVMYAIGLYVGLRLVSVMRKPVARQLDLALEIEATERAAHEAQVRAAKLARRKSKSTSKRRR